jgi:hypothetical protein
MGWVIVIVALVVIGLVLGLRRVRRGIGFSRRTEARIGYHDVEHTQTQRNFDKFGGGQI